MTGAKLLLVVGLGTLLLVSAVAASDYNLKIENVTDICGGHYATLDIILEPVGTDPIELGGFELAIAFDDYRLTYVQADAGDFYTECGWEYFDDGLFGDSYTGCCATCSPVNIIVLAGIADINNGANHPTCFAPTEPVQLATLTFRTTMAASAEYTVNPVEFYWIPDDCTNNTFSDKSGNVLIAGDSSFDHFGQPYAGVFNCSGPEPECLEPPVYIGFDYYSGSVEIIGEEGDRGDLNLNGWHNEIGDAVLYTDYFIYGISVLDIDLLRQVAASDINCDGAILTVGDLVYLIRIITGDALPCGCGGGFAAPRSSSIPSVASSNTSGDTLAFFGAEGYAGQQNIPFEIHVANTMDLGGLQARIEFDQAYITPSFDAAVGDGESVEFDLAGRASDFLDDGMVKVKSFEPGVLVVVLMPGDWNNLPVIPAGSGTILNVYFDVNPPLLPLRSSPVAFVDQGYDFNMFATSAGASVVPVSVDSTFTVVPGPPPPSCPVLFSYNGSQFIQEDALLTACEETGYTEVVTDYYHLTSTPKVENGQTRFQIREMEDEISYIESVELITVDHAASTAVACAEDGSVHTYRTAAQPCRAVDHNGVDCIAAVRSQDGVVYSSDEQGYLILEFPIYANDIYGYDVTSQPKKMCPRPLDPDDIGAPRGANSKPGSGEITIEIMDQDGNWSKIATPPPREQFVNQIVWSDPSLTTDLDMATVRISWSDGYQTDAIRQLMQTNEEVDVASWDVSDVHVETQATSQTSWSSFGNGTTLTLVKGDVFEFSFNSGEIIGADIVRDYIIRTVGRYQPDYSIHKGLVPGGYQLYENYPNPFNPTTTISYDLPEASHVLLEIYNLVGQKVTTLVNSRQDAGHKAVEWNGANAASGVYLYRLTTDSFSESKKMTLLK